MKGSDSTSTHISKSKTCFKNLVIRSFRWNLDKIQKLSDFLTQTKTFLRPPKYFGTKATPPYFKTIKKTEKVTSLYREPSFNDRLVVWCQIFFGAWEKFLSALQNHSFLWILLNVKVPSEKSFNTIFKTGLTFRNISFKKL